MNQPPQPPGGGYPQQSGQPNQYPQQPAPNQYGAQQQGGYGAQQPQYAPQHPGQAYPPQQPPYSKPGPNKGLGVVKLLVGMCLGLGLMGGLFAEGYQGIGVSAVLGVILGFGGWMFFSGIMNVAGKKLPLLGGVGLVVICAVVSAFAGPPISTSHFESQEQSAWELLADRPDDQQWSYEWDLDYFDAIPGDFQRPEANGMRKFAEVQEAIRNKDLVGVRSHIADIKQNHAGDETYRKAFNAASAVLQQRYDEELEKLGKPGVENPESGFVVDEDLRAAFKILLADLAESPAPDVYVSFKNESKLDAPEGHEEGLQTQVDIVKQMGMTVMDPPLVIDSGSAFSPSFDVARRNSFMSVGGDAFNKAFDATLFALKPLPAGDTRDGKLVLEVSSTIHRTNSYFYYTSKQPDGSDSLNGFLFGLVVEWDFKLFDRDGKQLYAKNVVSAPGSELSIIPQANDPDWAVYSILMDSAYFNYSRTIVGNFGLTPPAPKKAFAYSNYGVGE